MRKRIASIVLALLLIPAVTSAAAAQVTVDQVATKVVGAVSSLSFNLTLGSSATAVCVSVNYYGNGLSVSSVSVGVLSLTQIATKYQASFDGSDIWCGANPPTGTQTVSITMNTTAGTAIIGSAVSFNGASGVFNNATSTGGALSNSNNITLTTSSETNSLIFDSLTVQGNSETLTITGGQTLAYGTSTAPNGTRRSAGSVKAATSSVTTSWRATGLTSDNWAYSAINVVGAPALDSYTLFFQ